MERIIEPINPSHNRMILIMQSPAERDQFMKTFVSPMPTTHLLKWHWNHDLTRIIFEPVEIPAPVAADAQTGDTNAAVNATRAALITTLNAMDEQKLRTFAVEKEVQIAKKFSIPQIVAAIADKLAPAPTPTPKPEA